MTIKKLVEVKLAVDVLNRSELISFCGAQLVELGATSPEYVQAMLEREDSYSSYIGFGIALPHGTSESQRYVNRSAFVFVRLKESIDWAGESVTAVIAFSASEDSHVDLLGRIAEALQNESQRKWLMEEQSEAEIRQFLVGLDR